MNESNTFAKTLREYLEKHPYAEKFESKPLYFEDGDYLSRFMTDEACYAERIDQFVTIYRSFETNDFVGYKIKGVSNLLGNINEA